jgi:hypothetical protein
MGSVTAGDGKVLGALQVVTGRVGPVSVSSKEIQTTSFTADIRLMAGQEKKKQPWWERPAKAPGEREYVREREKLRAELARARRAGGTERGRRQPRRPDDSRAA